MSLSLYIPYVFSNVTKDKIIYTFEFHLTLGHIKDVDLVGKIDKKGKLIIPLTFILKNGIIMIKQLVL